MFLGGGRDWGRRGGGGYDLVNVWKVESGSRQTAWNCLVEVYIEGRG